MLFGYTCIKWIPVYSPKITGVLVGGGGLVLSSITCSIGYRYNVSILKYTTKHPCVYVNRYDSVGLINVNKSMLIRMKLMIYILNRTNQYICTLYVAIS